MQALYQPNRRPWPFGLQGLENLKSIDIGGSRGPMSNFIALMTERAPKFRVVPSGIPPYHTAFAAADKSAVGKAGGGELEPAGLPCRPSLIFVLYGKTRLTRALAKVYAHGSSSFTENEAGDHPETGLKSAQQTCRDSATTRGLATVCVPNPAALVVATARCGLGDSLMWQEAKKDR